MVRKHRAGILVACIVAAIALAVIVVMTRSNEPQATPAPTPDHGLISEQVSWPIGETTVYATITRPDGNGPYPAVVLVARTAGPDRDWNVPGVPGTNGSGRLLAEELARRDFATIRYDHRYTGQGAQENTPHLAGNISLASHVEEMSGAVEALLEQDYVDPDHIYVLSHGESSFLALNYHLDHDGPIAGLILAALPYRSLADLFIEQVQEQFQHLPERDEIVAGCEALIASFLEGEPFVPHPDVPPALNNYVSSLYDPRSLPFLREILPLDPADLLTRLTVPVLIVIGQKDIQINWQTDAALLQAATAHLPHIVYEFPQDADHVLKHQPKPREELSQADIWEYSAEGRVLDPEAVRVLIEWLTQQSQAD